MRVITVAMVLDSRVKSPMQWGDVGVNDRKPRIHARIHGRQTPFDAAHVIAQQGELALERFEDFEHQLACHAPTLIKQTHHAVSQLLLVFTPWRSYTAFT